MFGPLGPVISTLPRIPTNFPVYESVIYVDRPPQIVYPDHAAPSSSSSGIYSLAPDEEPGQVSNPMIPIYQPVWANYYPTVPNNNVKFPFMQPPVLRGNGYTLQVTPTLRRLSANLRTIFNGPCPDESCEVFVGRIPNDLLEIDLLPLFQLFGEIWEIKLSMHSGTNQNRGFAYVRYTSELSAADVVRTLNNYQIRPDQHLCLKPCRRHRTLYVNNIPRGVPRRVLLAEFRRRCSGVIDVITYKTNVGRNSRFCNRGFCFIVFDSRSRAHRAKDRLNAERPFWNRRLTFVWAADKEALEYEMEEVRKTLFVRNLPDHVTMNQIRGLFSNFGDVGRIKKIRDFAFIHYECREDARRALTTLQDEVIWGGNLKIRFSRPSNGRMFQEQNFHDRRRPVEFDGISEGSLTDPSSVDGNESDDWLPLGVEAHTLGVKLPQGARPIEEVYERGEDGVIEVSFPRSELEFELGHISEVELEDDEDEEDEAVLSDQAPSTVVAEYGGDDTDSDPNDDLQSIEEIDEPSRCCTF